MKFARAEMVFARVKMKFARAEIVFAEAEMKSASAYLIKNCVFGEKAQAGADFPFSVLRLRIQ